MIIFCEHAVETLEYFSRQLEECFRGWGYETFFLDLDRLGPGVSELRRRLKNSKTAATLITFNFIGLSFEDELWETDSDVSIWEELDIRCLNIMVDHPIYYYKQLSLPVRTLETFCVDRDHVDFMRRFYPHIPCEFLPLAGNIMLNDASGPGPVSCQDPGYAYAAQRRSMTESGSMPDEGYAATHGGTFVTGCGPADSFEEWMARPYPLVFTANYVPVDNIERQLDQLDAEYRTFYYDMIRAFLEEPDRDLLSVMEYYLRKEISEVTDSELCTAMSTMPAIDLWIRTYFREQVVRTLVDSGIPVRLFGQDWEMISCRHPENLLYSGRTVDSAECVRAMASAQIALNTMPWFKSGAHDRIFTAMLQGTVALTDDSVWLREQFVDRETLIYYDLRELERLPELVRGLQKDPERLYAIASCGYKTAASLHTWRNRADTLRKYVAE